MKTPNAVPKKIEDYIKTFPKDVQILLRKLKAAIKTAAPKAEEKISYRMPAFFLNGPLVYFAAYKKHIGFYPTSTPIKVFKKELASFEYSKGAIRLPLDEPLPLALIKKIVKFKIKENAAKAKLKKTSSLKKTSLK